MATTERIWVVEYRADEARTVDVIHYASTRQKAIDWCKNNLEWEYGHFWFAIYSDVIDDETGVAVEGLIFIDKQGHILDEQPI